MDKKYARAVIHKLNHLSENLYQKSQSIYANQHLVLISQYIG